MNGEELTSDPHIGGRDVRPEEVETTPQNRKIWGRKNPEAYGPRAGKLPTRENGYLDDPKRPLYPHEIEWVDKAANRVKEQLCPPSEPPIDISGFEHDAAVLEDAMYVLVSSQDSDINSVRRDLNKYFTDKRKGENQQYWEERITDLKTKHQEKHESWRKDQLAMQAGRHTERGNVTEETEPLGEIYCFHATKYPPIVEGSEAYIPSTYEATGGKYLRTTVHVSDNHVVEPVAAMGDSSSWKDSNFVVVANFNTLREKNGEPYGMLPQDTWWALGADSGLKLPSDTLLVARKGTTDIDRYKKIGFEVVEVDNPYKEAEQVAKEKGIRIIKPGDFHGTDRISDQLGVFCGFHLGNGTREGSESYTRAEASFISAQAGQTTKQINEFNHLTPEADKDRRREILLYLIQVGYFGEEYGSIGDHEDEYREDLVNEIIGQTPDFKKRFKGELPKINSLLDKVASDREVELTSASPALLKRRIDHVKENFDIIPPKLMGAIFRNGITYL